MSKRLGGRLVGFTAAAFAAFTIATGQAGAASSDAGRCRCTRRRSPASSSPSCRRSGFDVVDPEPTLDGVAVDLVLSRGERAAVESRGIELELFRNEDGLTARQLARAQAAGGYTVWRDYDGTDGIRQYLYDFVADHRRIAKLVVIGTTLQGREIIAVRITGSSRGHHRGDKRRRGGHSHDKPAVLYQGTTHAREWISTEVTRRLMEYFAGNSRTARKLRRAARALVPAGRQPRRLPVHVRPRAPVAQEPARQQRRRPDHQPRRRRHQPQLPRALELRRRGVEHRDLLRHLPRHRAGLRARDAGEHRPGRADRSGDGGLLPLLRPAPALPGGLAGADAGARPPGLPRAHRQRREPGGRGLRPGRLGRALHHQRRVHRLGAPRDRGRARLDPGARARAARAAASSSPTTRRWCSASSRSTCRSRSTWRARRPTRRGRSRTSATPPSRSTSSWSSEDPTFANNPLADFRFDGLLRRPAAG